MSGFKENDHKSLENMELVSSGSLKKTHKILFSNHNIELEKSKLTQKELLQLVNNINSAQLLTRLGLESFKELAEKSITTSKSITMEIHKLVKDYYIDLLYDNSISKIFQELILQTENEVIIELYYKIKPLLSNLLIHQCTNYLCQKLYFLLPIMTRLDFIGYIFDNFEKISNNKIGTFLIQKVFSYFEGELERDSLFQFLQLISKKSFTKIITVRLYLLTYYI
jgi:hypothetical protein